MFPDWKPTIDKNLNRTIRNIWCKTSCTFSSIVNGLWFKWYSSRYNAKIVYKINASPFKDKTNLM